MNTSSHLSCRWQFLTILAVTILTVVSIGCLSHGVILHSNLFLGIGAVSLGICCLLTAGVSAKCFQNQTRLMQAGACSPPVTPSSIPTPKYLIDSVSVTLQTEAFDATSWDNWLTWRMEKAAPPIQWLFSRYLNYFSFLQDQPLSISVVQPICHEPSDLDQMLTHPTKLQLHENKYRFDRPGCYLCFAPDLLLSGPWHDHKLQRQHVLSFHNHMLQQQHVLSFMVPQLLLWSYFIELQEPNHAIRLQEHEALIVQDCSNKFKFSEPNLDSWQFFTRDEIVKNVQEVTSSPLFDVAIITKRGCKDGQQNYCWKDVLDHFRVFYHAFLAQKQRGGDLATIHSNGWECDNACKNSPTAMLFLQLLAARAANVSINLYGISIKSSVPMYTPFCVLQVSKKINSFRTAKEGLQWVLREQNINPIYNPTWFS